MKSSSLDVRILSRGMWLYIKRKWENILCQVWEVAEWFDIYTIELSIISAWMSFECSSSSSNSTGNIIRVITQENVWSFFWLANWLKGDHVSNLAAATRLILYKASEIIGWCESSIVFFDALGSLLVSRNMTEAWEFFLQDSPRVRLKIWLLAFTHKYSLVLQFMLAAFLTRQIEPLLKTNWDNNAAFGNNHLAFLWKDPYEAQYHRFLQIWGFGDKGEVWGAVYHTEFWQNSTLAFVRSQNFEAFISPTKADRLLFLHQKVMKQILHTIRLVRSQSLLSSCSEQLRIWPWKLTNSTSHCVMLGKGILQNVLLFL